jgi:hypothetical protein
MHIQRQGSTRLLNWFCVAKIARVPSKEAEDKPRQQLLWDQTTRYKHTASPAHYATNPRTQREHTHVSHVPFQSPKPTVQANKPTPLCSTTHAFVHAQDIQASTNAATCMPPQQHLCFWMQQLRPQKPVRTGVTMSHQWSAMLTCMRPMHSCKIKQQSHTNTNHPCPTSR